MVHAPDWFGLVGVLVGMQFVLPRLPWKHVAEGETSLDDKKKDENADVPE